MPQHEYYICQTYRDHPLPWDLSDPTEQNAPAYFRGVLRAMERQLDVSEPLTFYLTWKLNELPSYGEDVVALVMGDEWGRIPDYAHRVLATFKCYGTRPPLEGNLLRHWSRLHLLLTLKSVRTAAYYLPGWMRHLHAKIRTEWLRGDPLPPMYPLPLGYGNQKALPLTPIHERSRDLFFAGSVEHGSYSPRRLQYWIESPKDVSRARMLEALERLAQRRPDLTIDVTLTSSFALNALHWGTASEDTLDADAYSRCMMDSTICPIPRGTSPETYRYFEALRYGCIPITEPLPDHWFYRDAPGIVVQDWSELGDVVDELLADPGLLERTHREALAWWEEVCSEEAVGTFIAERINALLPPSPGTEKSIYDAHPHD